MRSFSGDEEEGEDGGGGGWRKEVVVLAEEMEKKRRKDKKVQEMKEVIGSISNVFKLVVRYHYIRDRRMVKWVYGS